MSDDNEPSTLDERLSMNSWSGGPSAKERGAVQRAVNELLDTLAPEQQLTRRERATQRVEQHRTPSACILQGPTAAVSVTWFADAAIDGTFGELHLLVWRGVLTRRGAAANRGGARLISEQILRPIIQTDGSCLWEVQNGPRYDTTALAARCVALLEEQLAA